jgi:hypothetical protein
MSYSEHKFLVSRCVKTELVPRINVESLVKADPMSVPGEVNFQVRLNVCTY